MCFENAKNADYAPTVHFGPQVYIFFWISIKFCVEWLMTWPLIQKFDVTAPPSSLKRDFRIFQKRKCSLHPFLSTEFFPAHSEHFEFSPQLCLLLSLSALQIKFENDQQMRSNEFYILLFKAPIFVTPSPIYHNFKFPKTWKNRKKVDFWLLRTQRRNLDLKF